MRELFKAYSLSFLIHSFFVLGLLFLTQRMPFLEKRIIEIDLSFENLELEKEILAEERQKQTASRHAESPKVLQEDKAFKREEKASQVQEMSLPLPVKDETKENKVSQVREFPQEKPLQPPVPILSSVNDETKEDRTSQVQTITDKKPTEDSSPPSANQRIETEEKRASAQVSGDGGSNSSTRVSTQPLEVSRHAEESRKVSLEESFLREKLSIISSIVQRYANYPPIARRMGWEGKVLVYFVLEPTGEIRDLKILKGSGYEVLDREALEAIRRSYKDFPKPPVSVIVKLPVAFKLE